MKKKFIKPMYELDSIEDKNALSNYEARKLKSEILKNNNLGRQNIDIFAEGEKKFYTCKMYDPCPICRKCLNKASNLYIKCQTCKIPICTHSHSVKCKMIKRKNFIVKVAEKDFELISKEVGK